MVLTFDVGNTSIGIGVFDKYSLIDSYSIGTDKKKSGDEYLLQFKSLLTKYLSDIEGAIISSVVPELTRSIVVSLNKLFKIDPMILNSKLKTKVKLNIDNPQELGADLLADSFGAINKYGYPAIIADLGTTTKLLVVDNKGSFCGGLIFPGIGISFKSLNEETSLLTLNEISFPKHTCSKNTKDCINSGVLYGQIEAIEGLTKRIEIETGNKFTKILTGGYSYIIKDHLIDFIYDEHLIHDALINIYYLNKEVR